MMAHTHRLDVVADRIYDIILANKVALSFDDVFYGDQEQLPQAKSCCVEPVVVNREMAGAPDMVLNKFTVGILVYLARVQDIQTTRAECDALAAGVENLLHTFLNLEDASHTPNSDIVIQGWVAENLSGYSYKGSRLLRSARLTWTGMSKTSLRYGP